MDKQNVVVIVLRESFRESLLKDLVTATMIIVVIGVGVWLRSEAMQWIGFIMLILTALGRATARNVHFTPQAAADMLRDQHGVTSAPRPAP